MKKEVKVNPQFDDLQNPETYLNHIQDMHVKLEVIKQNKGLFKIKTANEWLEQAKTTPVPLMLFGEFWHEGELCILFADSNLGKSILAVQIADSISKGKKIHGFKLEAKGQVVLYFDFELSAKQFEVRYSVKNEYRMEFEDHYSFDKNFKRIEINPEAEFPADSSFEDFLATSLETCISESEAKVLVIDNLTYLRNETERAKDALPLMKHLKTLKSKYGLSILALAHTPKRDLSRPITQNDLQGSKMLFNFVDSCFAIGQSSNDGSIRYIKQIKARNTAMIYDSQNVVICQISKPHNFLAFEFLGFGSERDHLKQRTDAELEEMERNIIEMKASNPEMSLGEIARRLDTNKMKVKRVLDKSNQV